MGDQTRPTGATNTSQTKDTNDSRGYHSNTIYSLCAVHGIKVAHTLKNASKSNGPALGLSWLKWLAQVMRGDSRQQGVILSMVVRFSDHTNSAGYHCLMIVFTNIWIFKGCDQCRPVLSRQQQLISIQSQFCHNNQIAHGHLFSSPCLAICDCTSKRTGDT